MNLRQLSRRCTIEAVASVENLLLAAHKARRGKRRRPDVEDWWLRRETEVLALREELLTGSYQPGPYHFFEIHQPKRRLIAAAPFRDRVVHHALCNRMAPLLERTFIARSFSCQIGKGTTAARECCRRLTNRHRYVLKCDVRKFFPNIDHGVLLAKLGERVRCPGVMELIRRILASYRTGPEVPPPVFPGDDWVEAAQRPRGLPIGNLTSQLWGNFYLDGLDHWLTEQKQHGAYLRYTDDFLVFGDDKPRLWALREGAREQLAALRLPLAEPKSRLLATREGVPFCGFRFLPGLRPRVLGATKRRFEARRYALAAANDSRRLSVAVFAWYQFSREGNSEGLRRAYRRWPLAARQKRRQRRNARVLRGGSWNNNDPDNLLSSNRNNNTPDNRNDNNGFRCVLAGGSARKAERFGAKRAGSWLARQSQEDSSLTAVPVPARAGKDAAAAVAGNFERFRGESHGSHFPSHRQLLRPLTPGGRRVHSFAMPTTTITLEKDAYERLRLARLHGRESFSSVVRRARWSEKKHTAAELLAYMARRGRADALLDEAALDRLEAALAHPRRSASRWAKA